MIKEYFCLPLDSHQHPEQGSFYEEARAACAELARNGKGPHPVFDWIDTEVRRLREVTESTPMHQQLGRIAFDAMALRHRALTPNHEPMWEELQVALLCVKEEIESAIKR